LFLLPIVLARSQHVNDGQYHNRSIRLDLQIVLRSIFLNTGQELTEIGDVDDWWEGRNGGGFLGKITMVDGALAYIWYPIKFGLKDKKGHVPEILLDTTMPEILL
jgi:hypothetical protein